MTDSPAANTLDSPTSTGEAALPTASTDTAALEAAWADIRANHDDLPHVYFTTGSGKEGRQGQARWGHWAALRWLPRAEGQDPVGEVLIAGERLEFGAEGVMETLLHESAHALATVREIKDTSRNGRYHNGEYKSLAEEVGLDVEKGKHGWNQTVLPAATQEQYKTTVAALDKALAGYRVAPAKEEKEKKKKSRATLTCACERRIQVVFSVAVMGPINCGLCDKPFDDLAGDLDDYLADLNAAGDDGEDSA
jgi:hypothetical protein